MRKRLRREEKRRERGRHVEAKRHEKVKNRRRGEKINQRKYTANEEKGGIRWRR